MPRNRVKYIFTYGTLMACCTGRQGAYERAQMSEHARVVGPSAVRGTVYDAGACPAAILTTPNKTDRVRGEIWELRGNCADLLAVLDAYEGCATDSPRPFPYVRRRVRVRTPDGRRVTAWMYLWTGTTRRFPIVAGGQWSEPVAALQQLAACPVELKPAVKRARVPA